jgi:hypothetical protein
MLQKRTDEDRGKQSKLNAGSGGSEEALQVLQLRQNEIEIAIETTLPQGPRRRNRQIFTFARALKGIPDLAELPAGAFRQTVRTWHNRARKASGEHPFEDTWIDFRNAWGKVRVPLTADFLKGVLERAKAKPIEGTGYESPDLILLLTVCREFQAIMGDRPFFLSARTGARLLTVEPMTVCRWLGLLAEDGWLEIMEKGGNKTMRATRFRFIDGGAKENSSKSGERA